MMLLRELSVVVTIVTLDQRRSMPSSRYPHIVELAAERGQQQGFRRPPLNPVKNTIKKWQYKLRKTATYAQ
jgi:hypothetical protein